MFGMLVYDGDPEVIQDMLAPAPGPLRNVLVPDGASCLRQARRAPVRHADTLTWRVEPACGVRCGGSGRRRRGSSA